MSIRVQCKCGQRHLFPNSLAGTETRCNKCGSSFRVPATVTPHPTIEATSPAAATASQTAPQLPPPGLSAEPRKSKGIDGSIVPATDPTKGQPLEPPAR